MKRLSRILFANVVLVTAVYFLTTPQQKLDVRLALFGRAMAAADFTRPPSDWPAIGFLTSSATDERAFVARTGGGTLPLVRTDLAGRANVTAVKALIRSFSRGGLGGGCGERSADLRSNMEWVASGHGCCSDHAQVFVATALLHGVRAREAHHWSHTFTEFWDDSLRTWVWADPQFARMATDEAGRYLGLLEIHDRLKRGRPVVWDDFGAPASSVGASGHGHLLYAPAEFGGLVLVQGNNVFEVDAWNRRLSALPKPMQQLLLLGAGIQPRYGYLDDPIDGGPSLALTLLPYRLGMVAYVVANVFALAWAGRRRSTERGDVSGGATPTGSAPTPARRSPPAPGRRRPSGLPASPRGC